MEVLSKLVEDDPYQVNPEVRHYLRDVRDHALRLTDKVATIERMPAIAPAVEATDVSSKTAQSPSEATEHPGEEGSTPS